MTDLRAWWRPLLTGTALCAIGACSKALPPAPPVPSVTVSLPLERQVVDWDEYVGRFEAIQDVELRPRVSGTIDRVLFADGQNVRAGQALFIIDPRPYTAVLEQAEAQVARSNASLRNARSESARADKLVAAQAISREELEQKQSVVGTAVADLAAAQASVHAARLNLEFTTVRAPVSGRISDRRVSRGNYATAGTSVLTRVVSTDPMFFSFDGAESLYLKYMRQAQEGQRVSSRTAPNPVDIQLADEPVYRWHGRMSFVDNAINANSGTIRAHAVVANPHGFLTPGLFGRVRLLGSGRYRALLVPDESVLTDQSRKLVYVVGADGKAEARPVETGPQVEGLRVIKSGLNPKDAVVIDGVTTLQPGMKVQPHRIVMKTRAADTSPTTQPESAPPASEATIG